MRLGRPWGRGGRTSGTEPAGRFYARLFRDSAARQGLPIQPEAGTDTLAAGGLTEIGHRGGNLEWTIQLLFSAERVVGDGIVAGAGQAGTERRAGWQNVEFDGSFIAEHLRRQGPGSGWQSHQGDIARSGLLADRAYQ